MPGAFPGLKLPSQSRPSTGRTCDSSMSDMSGISATSSRMGELSNVRRELEEALQQVKDEMMAGGATRSELGSSMSSRSGRSRSSRSRCSSIASSRCDSMASSRCDSMASSRYSLDSSRPLTATSRPATSRPPTAASKKPTAPNKDKKKRKPLVSRPEIIRRPSLEPCPSLGAFKPKQFSTMNREDFVPLTLPLKGEAQNQGPTRAKSNKPEGSRPFTKFAENQSSASALLSSKVFAPRLAVK